MWFVFPQAAGLGRSLLAQRYAIASRGETDAYLAHPLLGPRLYESVITCLAVQHKTANQIFGSPDDIKFCSCLTLFDSISGNPLFGAALDRFFEGRPDPITQDILGFWTV